MRASRAGWLCTGAITLAAAAQAQTPALPRIAAVQGPACLHAGSELLVRGEHLGSGELGWSLALAGRALPWRERTDVQIRAQLPHDFTPNSAGQPQRVVLRSRSGVLLARAPAQQRICTTAAGSEDSPAPPSPQRGPQARSDGARVPLAAAAAESAVQPARAGELLVAAPDLATAAAVENTAQELGPVEPPHRFELPGLGLIVLRLRFADAAAAAAAHRGLQQAHPVLRIERKPVYEPEGDDLRDISLGLRRRIGWAREPDRSAGLRIGLIDTSIDARHPELRGARGIEESIRPADPARPVVHGTTVASPIVGRSIGLVPRAAVYAASVFWTEGERVVSSAEDLLRAIDWLSAQQVWVINLILAGPANALVQDALQRGIAVVAPVGNAGSMGPIAFPAAVDGGVAVTAVDGRMQRYWRAPQRERIDLAAPGVDVRVAAPEDPEGFSIVSGTSYAAPFVAAALALHPKGLAGLVADARDLGSPGRDPVYGWDPIWAEGLCAGTRAPLRPQSSAPVTNGGEWDGDAPLATE